MFRFGGLGLACIRISAEIVRYIYNCTYSMMHATARRFYRFHERTKQPCNNNSKTTATADRALLLLNSNLALPFGQGLFLYMKLFFVYSI